MNRLHQKLHQDLSEEKKVPRVFIVVSTFRTKLRKQMLYDHPETVKEMQWSPKQTCAIKNDRREHKV